MELTNLKLALCFSCNNQRIGQRETKTPPARIKLKIKSGILKEAK